jgi:hypothetical protein
MNVNEITTFSGIRSPPIFSDFLISFPCLNMTHTRFDNEQLLLELNDSTAARSHEPRVIAGPSER